MEVLQGLLNRGGPRAIYRIHCSSGFCGYLLATLNIELGVGFRI